MADRNDNSITRVFCAHPELPEPIAAMLEYLWRDALARGDFAKAAALERLAVRDNAAVPYWREFQSREKHRDSPRRGELEHPTVITGLWRDRDGHRFLLKALRKHPQRADIKAGSRWGAKHEYKDRQMFFVILLDRLAELATRKPDQRAKAEIAEHKRAFQAERSAWRQLRESGLAEQAEPHKTKALRHLVTADQMEVARREGKVTALGGPRCALDLDAAYLIAQVRGALSWHIGFVGYGIAAGLVSAALDVPISRDQAVYALKKFYEAAEKSDD
jgi:hypothetical protein